MEAKRLAAAEAKKQARKEETALSASQAVAGSKVASLTTSRPADAAGDKLWKVQDIMMDLAALGGMGWTVTLLKLSNGRIVSAAVPMANCAQADWEETRDDAVSTIGLLVCDKTALFITSKLNKGDRVIHKDDAAPSGEIHIAKGSQKPVIQDCGRQGLQSLICLNIVKYNVPTG